MPITNQHAKAATVYRHYKGGIYVVICVAETHEHNGDKDVVYTSAATLNQVTRPLEQDSRAQDSWTDPVAWPDGQTRNRFTVEEAPFVAMFK